MHHNSIAVPPPPPPPPVLGYQDYSQTGVIVVGTPVGQPAWVQQQCTKVADKACALVDTIMDLPELPKQHQLLLMRKYLQHKVRHLPRTVEHEHIAHASAQLEDKVPNAPECIMDVDAAQMPAAAQLQMTLPMRLGGLGLFKLTPEASEAAYLTCAAQAHAVLKDAAQPLRPCDGTRSEQLQQRWTTLVRAVDGVPGSEDFKPPADCVWTEEQRAPTEVVIEKAMPQAQREVIRHQQDAERARLMSMFDTANPHSLEGAQATARIRSCSGGAASAYLEVLPIAHNLRTASYSHLTWELRFRLGIQVMPKGSAGGRCPYGTLLRGPHDADHALVCSKHSGVRTLRHNHLNRVWCGAARCAGVATAVEPKLRALQMQPGVRCHAQAREDARGDVLLAMPQGMLVLDVNIVHAPAVAFLEGTVATDSSAGVDGAAAAIREKDKEDKYRRDIDGGAYEWVPVVMESGGRLGKGYMRVLNRLAMIAAESDGLEKHVFVRRAQEALSVARERGNGYVWNQGLQAMAYGGGRCFQTGLDRLTKELGGSCVQML